MDFDGIFETLREMDFANKQLREGAPKTGGDNIACVSMFGFPEKMDRQAPEARERIEKNFSEKREEWRSGMKNENTTGIQQSGGN